MCEDSIHSHGIVSILIFSRESITSLLFKYSINFSNRIEDSGDFGCVCCAKLDS